jgi:glycosyltransferase involved in cell wall biosynthesis
MPKRICLISSEYPPETGFGGIGTYTHIMAHALSNRGHEVIVIALSEKENRYEIMDGAVRVLRVTAGKYPLPQGRLFWRLRMLAYRFLPHSLIRMAFAVSVAETFEKLSKERKIDVVEAADCGAESYYLKLPKETKFIIRLHTPYSFSLKFNNQGIGVIDRKRLESMEKRCTLKADCVTSPTEALAAYLIREWNIKKVEIFPNPIDYSNMPVIKRDTCRYIVHTGRLEYRKGTHLLIKAYGELVKSGAAENLLLIGRSYGSSGVKGVTYEKAIFELINKLELNERVEWIHGLPRNELLKHLEKAKVAVFPAIWDNYPYAALEMMASGIPVVCFNSGGFAEMVRDGKDGLLAKAMDYKDLAIKIKKVVDSANYAATLSESAKERVLKICDAEAIAKKNEEVYGL